MSSKKKAFAFIAACLLVFIITKWRSNELSNGRARKYTSDINVERTKFVANLSVMSAVKDEIKHSGEMNTSVDGPGHYDKWAVDRTETQLVNDKSLFCFITGQNHKIHANTTYITIKTDQGRLGNRFFQVASLIGIAHLNGFVPVLQETNSLFEYFNLRARRNCSLKLQNVEVYTEVAGNKYEDKVKHLSHCKNWTLDGYFQSWKYFDRIKSFHKVFELKKEYKTGAFMNFWNTIHNSSAIKVCIHVRRGDFLTDFYIEHGYAIPDLSYFNRSMDYFIKKFKTVQFVFLSNGIDWCKEHFGDRDNVHFSPFTEAILDMEVMKSCDHVITSIGSFGWWGAWLAGGEVIYYKGFPRPGSWLDSRFNKEDYFRKEWIVM